MKNIIGFLYAIISYSVGFAALVLWILFTGNLLPIFSIDNPDIQMTPMLAVLKNIGLIALFGIQHSVMARQPFKHGLTQWIPVHLERSTYVFITGLLLAFILWQWEPLPGIIWSIAPSSLGFYLLYGFFFLGWSLLLISTFLINHFDLFGLRQAYLKLAKKPYKELPFKVKSLYKLVRHPLYLGMLLGIWSTPTMTMTHLIFSILLTTYLMIGIYHEEKDLIKAFGNEYLQYKTRVPKLIPFTKFSKRKAIQPPINESVRA